MSGRWRVVPRGTERRGKPWLVLRGRTAEAVLWNGPVLELGARGTRRLGPDILADPPDLDAIASRLRADPSRAVGDALLDQRLIAGIGNVWKAESLWRAGVSPWRPVGELSDEEVGATLGHAAALMRESLEGGRPERRVYRRTKRPCPRCGTPIASRGQGEANRTAYWCPGCQR
jgi:endonuclease-8